VLRLDSVGSTAMGRSSQVALTLMGLTCLNGQAPLESPGYKITSEVKLVLLDVSARDSRGNFVSGLRREDFHVFDNRREQPIRVFSGEDTPVTVGLLIDSSSSMRTKRGAVAKAALALIQASNSQGEMFVVSFGDRVSLELPEGVAFTDDQNLLRNALARRRPEGQTALYDALQVGLEHLRRGGQERKTLVLISDGGDTASRSTAGQILQMAHSSNVTIHVVGIYDQDEKDRNIGFLKRLAKTTGGEAIIEYEVQDLVTACQRIAKDIRSRYTIGYQPPDTAGPETRKIHVVISTAKQAKLSAQTRESYTIPALGEEQ
jgi:Ca-activated chloride channel homolog